MLSKQQVEELKGKSWEAQQEYANKVSEVIKTFLETKYKNIHGLSISYEAFYYLLDGKWDFGAEIFSLKYNCMKLLEALSHPLFKEIKNIDTLKCAEVLSNIISFSEAIDGEASRAQLALAYIEENGGGEVSILANMEKEYSDKIKVSEFKKKYCLDPDTAYEMGLEESVSTN
jgi:hypothetical protein